jgi:hypothetical protein
MPDLFRFEITPSLELVFQGLSAHVDDLETVLNDVGEAYFLDTLAPFVDDLGSNPGPAITMIPEEWTSMRQYWAHRFTRNWGRGLPYNRPAPGEGLVTGAWESAVTTDANSLTVNIRNTNPEAIFVYGDFSANPEKPQQRYLRKIGWRLAKPLMIDFFLQSARDLGPKIFTTWWIREKS